MDLDQLHLSHFGGVDFEEESYQTAGEGEKWKADRRKASCVNQLEVNLETRDSSSGEEIRKRISAVVIKILMCNNSQKSPFWMVELWSNQEF